MGDSPANPGKRRGRRPAAADEATLRAAALLYLERYPTSSHHLKRVLLARVERAVPAHGSDRDDGRTAVERIVAGLLAGGVLDDRAYAVSMARAWHRRGTSAQAIRAKLAAKGIGPELAEEAMTALRDELSGDPDLGAVAAYARRRRLGPFRSPERRGERRDRDLAALARAGFALDLARAVIEAESPEDLDGLLEA